MVSHNNKQAILATLIYSNIFDFPLTKEELWQFLISKTEISKAEFEIALKKNSQISQVKGFFCLKGKENIINKRKNQKNELNKKLAIAKRAARYISYIPSIKLIGISGSIAMGDAKKEDDIDFFIITQKGSLWTTRFWVLAVLEAMNLRRKRGEMKAPDKICCNLFIEENNLNWPNKKQNIYTAHEIVQMKPIFERQNMYRRFLTENQWIKKYFPNFKNTEQNFMHTKYPNEYYTVKAIQYLGNSIGIKKVIEIIQEKYMKRHQTKEIIKKNFLALHPNDYAANTIHLFNYSLKKYGLLTNI